MHFHFCKEGETLFSIAREYGASPVRVMEENRLIDPDRLAVGQCIAIFESARSYTVRGGDTFESIRRRFDVSEWELLKFNPGIGEKRLLYPGQSLTIIPLERSMGSICVNGMVSKHIPLTVLQNFSSALTYLTIFDSNATSGSGLHEDKELALIKFCNKNAIVPLARLQISPHPERQIDRLLSLGYRGALLDGDGDKSLTLFYLERMKKERLVRIFSRSLVSLIDAEVDWQTLPFGDPTIPMERRYRTLVDSADFCYDSMPELPCRAVEIREEGGEILRTHPLTDCARLAYRKNARIEKTSDGMSRFTIGVTSSGIHEKHQILFSDLEAIKKGLTVLGESGCLGLSIYPQWCPSALPTLLGRCFDVIREQDRKIPSHYAR